MATNQPTNLPSSWIWWREEYLFYSELVPYFKWICVQMWKNSPSRPKKYESTLKNTFVGFGLAGEFSHSQKSYVWSCNYRPNDQLIKINYRSLKLICSFQWFYALTSHQWIKANSQSFTEKSSFSKYCYKFLKSSREIVISLYGIQFFK